MSHGVLISILNYFGDHGRSVLVAISASNQVIATTKSRSGQYYFNCCCCLPTPMILASGGGGEYDVPACDPPTSFSVHLASSADTPVGSVHKSRGDNVVCMWVQLKR